MNAVVNERPVRSESATASAEVKDRSRQLAAEIAAWTPAVMPDDVRSAGRRFLLDTLGVIAAARNAPGIDVLNRRLARWEANGSATGLIGKYRYSPPHAALANGAAAHALDFDDQHDPARVHGNCIVIPTVLAIAEEIGVVDGERLLLAWTVGMELHARLGLACYNSLGKGWHPTMVHGSMAAAVAGAKLLELDEAGIAHALGIAYHQAGGSIQSAADGVLSKRIGAGFAARNAVTSALLAADGITGTQRTFDGAAGFFALYERGEVDANLIFDGLGRTWRTLEYSVKPYPCCRCIHTLIGMGIALHQRGIRADDVASIEAGIGEVNWRVVGAPFDPARDEVAHCQFNAAYTLACALIDGEVSLRHFRRPSLTHRDYAALALRTRVISDPAIEATAIEPAWIKLVMRDGREIRVEKQTIKGSPAEPLTEQELAAKFGSCMREGAGVSDTEAERLAQAVSVIAASRDAAGDLVRAFPELPKY